MLTIPKIAGLEARLKGITARRRLTLVLCHEWTPAAGATSQELWVPFGDGLVAKSYRVRQWWLRSGEAGTGGNRWHLEKASGFGLQGPFAPVTVLSSQGCSDGERGRVVDLSGVTIRGNELLRVRFEMVNGLARVQSVVEIEEI